MEDFSRLTCNAVKPLLELAPFCHRINEIKFGLLILYNSGLYFNVTEQIERPKGFDFFLAVHPQMGIEHDPMKGINELYGQNYSYSVHI